MKIFRVILLALAMALFALNFWSIDYQDILSKQSLWAFFRIAFAFMLVLLLVGMVRKDLRKGSDGKIKIGKKKKSRV